MKSWAKAQHYKSEERPGDSYFWKQNWLRLREDSRMRIAQRNGFVSDGAVAVKRSSFFPDRSEKKPPEGGRYICSGRAGAFRPAGTREALPGTNAALKF